MSPAGRHTPVLGDAVGLPLLEEAGFVLVEGVLEDPLEQRRMSASTVVVMVLGYKRGRILVGRRRASVPKLGCTGRFGRRQPDAPTDDVT